jgi:hypothetical protein
VNIVSDAVDRDGMVVCPAKAWEIQDYARESGCRIAVFATDDDVTARDSRRAPRGRPRARGRIIVEGGDGDEGLRSRSIRRCRRRRRSRRRSPARRSGSRATGEA